MTNTNLLQQRITDLTEAQKADLRKPLGTRGRPYPMTARGEDVDEKTGEVTAKYHLGVIENDQNTLELTSERDYADVIGRAYREMVTPSMLPMFKAALEARRFDNKNRGKFYVGAPGIGKTYMSELIARMRSKNGAIKVDCGGKNLNDLLFEMVLDISADKGRVLLSEINRRFESGRINPLSRAQLEAEFSFAMVGDAPNRSIDWDKVAEVQQDTSNGSAAKSIDEVRSELQRRKAIIERIASMEGLDASNSLGLRVQEGWLIKAFKEGRELVLDEYNKSKEGTDDRLQTVLQFIAGEIDECTVESPFKEKGDVATQTYTFRRREMKAGFFVTLTGNELDDGSTTRSLNASVYSRLNPEIVPNPTEQDWQHRLCQILTGVPISTLYRAGEGQWRHDKEGFTRFLMNVRKTGLSAQEQQNIPAVQFALIRNWEKLLEATGRLSTFYYNWSQLVNPNSDAVGRSPELSLEVSEEYYKKMAVDFRKVIRHVETAMFVSPTVITAEQSHGFADLDDWSRAPTTRTGYREDPQINFGTRYVEGLLNLIYATTEALGKRKLYEKLMGEAEKCALTGKTLHEGTAAKRKLVSDLLNINPYVDDAMEMDQARLVQQQLCDNLRRQYAELSTNNDEIVSVGLVLELFRTLRENAPSALSASSNVLVMPTSDLDKVLSSPMVTAPTQDAIVLGDEMTTATVPADELATLDSLLFSLTLPRIGTYNLGALWNRALSGSGLVVIGEGEHADQAAQIAENVHGKGLAVTSIQVQRANDFGVAEASTVHVVMNRNNGRTLLVGDAASDERIAQLRYRGISYIDRSLPGATQAVARELALMLGKESRHTVLGADTGKPGQKLSDAGWMRQAFLLRNLHGDGEVDSTLTLAELLTSPEVECRLPHYIKAPQAGTAPNAHLNMPKVA